MSDRTTSFSLSATYFCNPFVELGFDMKTLSEILGHSNINTTLNRYVHPSMEQKQQNMDKLNAVFTVK